MKNIYIYNDHLYKKHSIPSIIKSVEDIGESKGWKNNESFRTAKKANNTYSIRYEIGDLGILSLLFCKFTGEESVNDAVDMIVKLIEETKKSEVLDRVYIHLTAPFDRPPHFRDYINVKAANKLVEEGAIGADNIIFFSSYDQIDGFNEETGYKIQCIEDAEKLMEVVMRDGFAMV